MDYTPITNPPGWTAEDDMLSLIEHFDSDYHSDAALGLVSEASDQFTEFLDDLLAFYERRSPLRPVNPGTLTATEKLHRLTVAIEQGELDPQVKGRLLSNLAGCEWAEKERARVLQSYYASQDKDLWLHRLCGVADALVFATVEVYGTMREHHPDFETEA